MARRIVGRHDIARDILQDARFSQLQTEEELQRPAAWLHTAVVNRSLHAARSERRRASHEAEAARRTTCPLCDPAEAIARRELVERLEHGLHQLCREHREVFRLKIHEGLEYTAIAQHLGIPVGTVRSRLNRARRALRDHLGEDFSATLSPDMRRTV